MDLDSLQEKLLAAARACPPDDRVPYAFERRIMARLGGAPVFDGWALWARGLWRAAAPCVAIMCATLVWSVFSPNSVSGDFSTPAGPELAADLESIVLAPLNPAEDTW